jgi:hypothetical protein
MEEVWGSNPHSSTIQGVISNPLLKIKRLNFKIKRLASR